MTEVALIELARTTFAEVTGELEDAALLAAEAQASANLAAARQSCDRLIAVLEGCLDRMKRLRRQLK